MFYIHPPKGLVPLHRLEEIVFTRLEYLNALYDDKVSDFDGRFEYLLEGSCYDSVGHFTLRLLTSSSTELFSYWIKRETVLFSRRLSHIYPRQLSRLFNVIIKHLKKQEKFHSNIGNALHSFILQYSQGPEFKHITDPNHSDICTAYHSLVSFDLVPDLVQSHSVDLNRGFAKIYCSQWRELIRSFFRSFISQEVENENGLTRNVIMDPRLNSLLRRIRSQLSSHGYSMRRITAANVDIEASNFPPCMQHLHDELRSKHRLSHYARFYFTLFLKECGMKIEDSITYWREEYSKPHTCQTSCVHDWHKDVKKFTYSIRHMYGLEGANKNYKTPNCRAFCKEVPGPKYEGGCPFANFNDDKLKAILKKSMSELEVDKFLRLTSKRKPEEACLAFSRLRRNNIPDVSLNSPVQYYLQMIDYT